MAVGVTVGPSYARVLLQLSDVKPSAMVPIDTDEALAELKAAASTPCSGRVSREALQKVTEADQLALSHHQQAFSSSIQ